MLTEEFNFGLPKELIAQHPASKRDESRLLVFQRPTGEISHRFFKDFPDLLNPGDLLVLNNSKVIPARLPGIRPATGGAIEFLFLEEIAVNDWWVMLRPAKRLRPGDKFQISNSQSKPIEVFATLVEKNEE